MRGRRTQSVGAAAIWPSRIRVKAMELRGSPTAIEARACYHALIKRGGKLWIRIFSGQAFTKKRAEPAWARAKALRKMVSVVKARPHHV